MESPLKGQVYLVTGGAQGLGWALCQALAERGARVHACDISTPNLQQAQQVLRDQPWGEHIHLEPCDVADRAAFEGWIGRVHQREGRLDGLINNAAYVCWEDVTRMSVEQAERTMRVGYEAMLYGLKAVLPVMLAAGHGSIVNIGSIAGRIYVGGASAAYCAAKAAIDAYTQTLQVELRHTPLHIMLVRPSTIAGTDFFRVHVPSTRMPRLADFTPYLKPPEVAHAILQGLQRRTRILNIPRSNALLEQCFNLAPWLLRWAVKLGGSSRKRFGDVPWNGQPGGKQPPNQSAM